VPPFPAFDRSFERKSGLAVCQDHEAIGKVLVNVPTNESVHSMAPFDDGRDVLLRQDWQRRTGQGILRDSKEQMMLHRKYPCPLKCPLDRSGPASAILPSFGIKTPGIKPQEGDRAFFPWLTNKAGKGPPEAEGAS